MINYINSGKTNFGVFIAYQVNKISNSSKMEECFFVPTNQNVTDDMTHYKGFNNLTNRSRWCTESDFLHKEVASESLAINSITNNKQYNTVMPDDVTNKHLENKETKSTNSTSKRQSNLASKINWRWYSSFFTLTRHVAWIIKLKTNWIKRRRGAPTKESTVIRNFSTQQFKNFTNLHPIFHNSLINVGGRISHANIPEEFKHQVIVSKHHHETQLILRNIHKNNLHVG